MSNGRSFSRNRKNSPAKSQRRAIQHRNAMWAAEAERKAQNDSLIMATAGALEKIKASLQAQPEFEEVVEQLAASSAISKEDAEALLVQTANAALEQSIDV